MSAPGKEQLADRERINEVLLELSNRMVKVRDRADLLHVINSGLREVINFTACVMTILDEAHQTYNAFLTDPKPKFGDGDAYYEAISTSYPVADGIYDVAAKSDEPVLFDLRSFDVGQAPLWCKLHYAAGAREMMVKMLPGEDVPRHSLILFSDETGTFDACAMHIIERISNQLSTAARNITANEEILNRESEKSFLLKFSQNIAAVRTKADLETAISEALQYLLGTRLAMIRVIEDDGHTLTPYLWDDSLFTQVADLFDQLANRTATVDEYFFAQVLGSREPIVIDIAEEEAKGNSPAYILFWKRLGMKKVYASALRVGQENVGTMFFLSDNLNLNLLKGLCAQISIAISNIRANEKILAYKQLLEIENDQLKEQIRTIYNFSEIVGSGPEMQEVYHLMSLVADSASTVLLLGETGTGKELIARAIHNASPRKNKVMIKLNCAALPANLIESELFGHERGAFTGAVERRIGKFELADNSTLFLDEIGEMPLEAQVKLLRVLQEKELERIGGKVTIKVNVRIIAATNRNLEEEVRLGRFRADLYYRLNVFPITLPPLRNRPDDIIPLAHFFVDRYRRNSGRKVTGLSPGVMQELQAYPWPGNVRELEHLMERSVLLAGDGVIREVHLPRQQPEGKAASALVTQTLSDVERSYIIEVLKQFSGKISGLDGAAAFLQIPATTLHSKIKKLKISKADYF
ncbi:sigma 54-interacting transcriptional regulator [Dyadobacter sp.]|uniref:sigma 54-interacting transcriptional regulator n=1 Tax=Dyadobacter sp. TaxID=1914288 RepID=UPI0025BAF4FE|nr:sigma 54-interacting transcriptional regulator [Dyadobacter sp.]